MAIIKSELRPKGDKGTYDDVVYLKTSYDMVEGAPQVKNSLEETVVGNVLDATQGKALKVAIETKANTSHTHTATEITGLPTALTPLAHTHPVTQITGITYPVTSVAGKTGAVTLAKADVSLGSVENFGLATQAEAQAGTTNAKYMTPLRVAEEIASKAIPIGASCNKNWVWNGQGGQPSWLWGGSDGTNMYVYNPSNFSVSYAVSAGSATSATSATNATNATNATFGVSDVNYTTRKLRNVVESTAAPSGGSNGDIWIRYS